MSVALFLLLCANGGPMLVAELSRLPAIALDGGLKAWDGNRLLGASKTANGILGAYLVTMVGAFLVGVANAGGSAPALPPGR